MNTTYGQASGFRQWCYGAFLTFLLVVMPQIAEAATFHIVAFGDSLSAGYQLPQENAFPVRLEAALRAKNHDVQVINAGVSGDTSGDGVERMDWSVPDGTDLVILELGANDMLRGQSPEVMRTALAKILERLQQREIKVLLCGMRAAPNMGEDYSRQFEAVFADLAKQFDVPLYPFFLEGMARDPKLTLADGMHPNAGGVDVIVAGILPSIEAFLSQK